MKIFYHYDEYTIAKKDITQNIDLIKQSKFRPALLQYHDLDALIQSFPHKEALFRQRLQQGFICVVCFDGQKIVGYAWATDQSPYFEPFINYKFHFEEDEYYQFDGEVLPQYRGKQVAYLGLNTLWEYYRKKGKKFTIATYSNVRKYAKASRRMHQKMGFVPSAILKFRRILFWRQSHLGAISQN